jgi:hypothetical protein
MGSSCSHQRGGPAATTAAPHRTAPRPPRLSLDSTSTVRDDGACTVTVSRSDGNTSDCGILELSPQRGPTHRTMIVSSPLTSAASPTSPLRRSFRRGEGRRSTGSRRVISPRHTTSFESVLQNPSMEVTTTGVAYVMGAPDGLVSIAATGRNATPSPSTPVLAGTATVM